MQVQSECNSKGYDLLTGRSILIYQMSRARGSLQNEQIMPKKMSPTDSGRDETHITKEDAAKMNQCNQWNSASPNHSVHHARFFYAGRGS